MASLLARFLSMGVPAFGSRGQRWCSCARRPPPCAPPRPARANRTFSSPLFRRLASLGPRSPQSTGGPIAAHLRDPRTLPLCGFCRRLSSLSSFWHLLGVPCGSPAGRGIPASIAIAAVCGFSPGVGVSAASTTSPVKYTVPATPEELEVFIPAIRELAAAAEAAIRPYYLSVIRVELKADSSPVTAADRAAEQAMRNIIERRFPCHAIVGEEFGSTAQLAEYRWVLDPIDGTKAFITNCPLFGTLVALERWVPAEQRYRPLLGAINLPAVGQMLIGWRDSCVLHLANGTSRPVHVRPCKRIDDATVLLTSLLQLSDPRQARIAPLVEWARLSRTWGDCFGYFTLATGAADVMLDTNLAYWDVAAVVPVVEGAGGRITSWTGGDPVGAAELIATAGPLHEVILAAVGPCG